MNNQMKAMLDFINIDGLGKLFGSMEITEDLIAEFQSHHPEKEAELFDAFLTVIPTHNMLNMHSAVFESHVRELLQRVVDGEDLTAATNAEIVCVISVVSAQTPLTANAAYLFSQTFRAVFGEEKYNEIWKDLEPHERYPGASGDLRREVSQKAGNKERHQPDPERWNNLKK